MQMYKIRTNYRISMRIKKGVRLFYLTIVLGACINIGAVCSQRLITTNFKNKTVKDVFKELHSRYGIKFVYSSTSLPTNKLVSGDFTDAPLDQVLKHVLSKQGISYTIQDNTVVL